MRPERGLRIHLRYWLYMDSQAHSLKYRLVIGLVTARYHPGYDSRLGLLARLA